MLVGVSSFLYIGEGEEAIQCTCTFVYTGGRRGEGRGVAVHSFEPFLVI